MDLQISIHQTYIQNFTNIILVGFIIFIGEQSDIEILYLTRFCIFWPLI